MRFTDSIDAMRHAIRLAARGIGFVEPNPPVGAVLTDTEGRLIGEGWHERYGGPHAEVNALKNATEPVDGATLYVTLEPCCHQGKTPPCTQAVIAAGVGRVVIAHRDPAPHVDGGGIAELRDAGIEVEIGLLEDEAAPLTSPFVKLVTKKLPYVHLKWAMSLDGKIATACGHSQWISNEQSRNIVHALRGRMNAVIVGRGTVDADDPLLTARPSGPRRAARIVLDRTASLPLSSQLVRTARESPVIVAATSDADEQRVAALESREVEVMRLLANEEGGVDVHALLTELGRRDFTNILVEGGGQVLGSFFDGGQFDEVHAFIAPKLVGGEESRSAMGGQGLREIPQSAQLDIASVRQIDHDLYVHLRRREP